MDSPKSPRPTLKDLKNSASKLVDQSSAYLSSNRTPGRLLDARLPMLFDLVEDRSQFRALTLALFLLVLLFVFRTALYVVFLSAPDLVPPLPQVFLSVPPQPLGASAEIGVPLPPLWVSVSGASGESLSGVTVQLSLAMVSPEDSWATRFRYVGTALAEGGVPLSGLFSLPGFPPAALAPGPSAFVGTASVSGLDGRAFFRGLTLLHGLPCAYAVTASAAGAAPVQVGMLNFVTSVARVELEEDGTGVRGGVARPLLLGGALPLVRVRAFDARGRPLIGKTAILFNAPAEAAEFASSGARGDVFDPRVALLDGAVSLPSDGSGAAVFRNVTLRASSLRNIRLWAAVDGVVARRALDGSAALAFSVSQTQTFRLTLVGAPSGAVVEGAPLATQPAVLVERAALDASGLPVSFAPAAGVTVLAYVRGQPGFVGGAHALGPRGVAELQGLVAGTPDSVLANLGRVKHLFGFASKPSGGDGKATFDALGFISHGPAGVYTLGFAVAGVACGALAESSPIAVATSVASVVFAADTTDWGGRLLMDSDDNRARVKAATAALSAQGSPQPFNPFNQSNLQLQLAAVVCNFPTCASLYNSVAGGGAFYNHSDTSPFPGTFNYTAAAYTLPALFSNAPSGVLSTGPVLLVSDSEGRPLAGKGASLSADQGLRVAEFPFAGASVSKLFTPQYVAKSTPLDSFKAYKESSAQPSGGFFIPVLPLIGALSFLRVNLDITAAFFPALNEPEKTVEFDPRRAYAAETFDFGSYLRVVAAPRGHTIAALTLSVEGTAAPPIQLDVFNADDSSAPPACAHLEVVQNPTRAVQKASTLQPSLLPLLGPDGAAKPFSVQSIDSTGKPVKAMGDVGMYVVDALGAILFPANGTSIFFKAEQAQYLRSLGGAGALAGQALQGSFAGLYPAPPVDSRATTPGGSVEFPQFPVALAQNTWVRFAFVALQLPLSDHAFPWQFIGGAHQFYPAPGACVSQFSDPVALTRIVAGVTWAAAGGVTLDPLEELLPRKAVSAAAIELPAVRAVGVDGLPVAAGTTRPILFAIADPQLSLYPAQVGATAVTSWFDARPDPSLQTLLQGQFFSIVANGQGNDAVLTPLQSGLLNGFPLTDIIFEANNLAGVSASLGSAAWPFNGPVFRFAAPNASLFLFDPLTPFSVTSGKWAFCAIAGGEITAAPMRYSVLDSFDAVVVVPRAPPPVFSSVTASTSPTPSASPTATAQSPSPSAGPSPQPCPSTPCPNGCSGQGACWCGVCVCTNGFEGAHDCSIKLIDGASVTTSSPYYERRYGGVPVYDVRRALELGRLNKTQYTGDLFPRVLLPEIIAVLRMASPIKQQLLQQPLSTLDISSPLFSASVQLSVMVGDAINDALLGALGIEAPTGLDLSLIFPSLNSTSLVNFDKIASAPASTVFPSLVTCSGDAVQSWQWAVPATGCSSPVIPVTNPFDDYAYSSEDHRLLLLGLPTGCYRFQLSYLPKGPGSLQARTISSLDVSAQAVSFGASPPFRVLNPLLGISMIDEPLQTTITLPFDSTLALELSIRLYVRPRSPDVQALKGGSGGTLTDSCSDVRDPVSIAASGGSRNTAQVQRCGATPIGGLEVYASAVSEDGTEVFSLYVPGMYVDCARTGEGYVAKFPRNTLRLPRSPAAPPGAPGGAGAALRADTTYRLRFTSYGMSVDAGFNIVLVDKPTHVLVDGAGGEDARYFYNNNNGDLPGTSPQVAVMSVGPSCCNVSSTNAPSVPRVYSVVDSTGVYNHTIDETWTQSNIFQLLLFGDGMPLGGTQVVASILYAPVNSNAALNPLGVSVTTDIRQNGVGTFSNFAFTSGVSGLYALQFAAPPAQPAILLVQLNNSVSSVSVDVSGASVAWGAPPLLPAVSGSLLTGLAIRVCARSNWHISGANTTATFSLFAADGSSPPPVAQVPLAAVPASSASNPDPAWLAFARATTPLELAPGGTFSPPRFAVALPLSAKASAAGSPDVPVATLPTSVPLGTDGCATLQHLNFVSVANSQRVRLIASVAGVEGPPIDFELQSLADAHPVSLQTLQSQLWVPLLVIVPLFGANSVNIPLDLRVLCLAAGLGCILFMGLDAGRRFLSEDSDMAALYPPEDNHYVSALTALWWAALGIVAALTAVSAASLAPAGCSLLSGAVRRRRERGAGAAHALLDVLLWRCGGLGASRAPALRDQQWPAPLTLLEDTTAGARLLMGGFHALRLHHCRQYVARMLLKHSAAEKSSQGSSSSSGGSSGEMPLKIPASPGRTFKLLQSGFAATRPARTSAGKPLTLAQRLRAALCSCEDPALAFFFPQRLLVAALLALFACVVIALLALYTCDKLGGLASSALASLHKAGQNAVARALEARELQADLQAGAVRIALGSLGASNGVASTAAPALSASLNNLLTSQLLQALSTSALLSGLPGLANGTIAPTLYASLAAQAGAFADGLSADTVIANLVDGQVSLLTPWVDALVVQLKTAVMRGVLLAFTVVVLALWGQLLNYRRIVLAVRRGDRAALPSAFAWHGPTAGAANATAYVGLQFGGTAVSFALFAAIFSVLCFLLSTPLFTGFLVRRLGIFLLSLVGVAMGLTALRMVVLNYVATRGSSIVLRRCHSCADLWLTFFGLFTGLLMAVVRWGMLQVFFLVALIRADIHVMPYATRVDPFAKAFDALLMHDIMFNSPVMAVALEELLQSLGAARRARSASRREGGGGAEVVVVNPLNGGRQGAAAPAAPVQPLTAARMRARTRWRLALLLLQNPSLRCYRKQKEVEIDT